MQGVNASKEIIEGIKTLQNYKLDVIIITRGGGSIEDLMCFNNEELVREAAKSKIPIISAVGHEIDWTLIDYVADLRLPTPTSVAEHLTMSKEQAYKQIETLFKNFIFKKITKLRNKQSILWQKIKLIKKHIFIYSKMYLDKKNKLYNFLKRYILNRINKLNKNKILLNKININNSIKLYFYKKEEKLKNITIKFLKYTTNFPIVKDLEGNTIKSKKDTKEEMEIYFKDGKVKVRVLI
jgi:exodeoxyribonuclease VII large subunit